MCRALCLVTSIENGKEEKKGRREGGMRSEGEGREG